MPSSLPRKGKIDWGARDLPDNPSVTLRRLADQINFFNIRSKQNQNRYKWLKAATLLAAAVITASTALSLPIWVVPVLGVAIIFIEGVLSLSSSHHNWLVYRKTCEALKHEKYLFLANAGVYQEPGNREALLAERVEAILSIDHETWLKFQAPKEKDQNIAKQ